MVNRYLTASVYDTNSSKMALRAFLKPGIIFILLFLSLLCVYKQTQRGTPSLNQIGKEFKNVFWNVQVTERIKAYYPTEMKLKKIVYWKPFSHHKDFAFGIGHEPFVAAKCKISACNATFSHEEVNDADALMFHLPDCRGKLEMPANRLPHQLYVFIVRESQAHPHLKNIQRFNNFFNIAMTFSREADVLFPFGRIEKRGKIPYRPYAKDIMQKKTKFALAIISHCQTDSRREVVVKNLQVHMQIDILGTCNKHRRSTQACEKSFGMDCMRKIITKYKFYLAFESYLCRDYASEKLYKVLDLPVIPIVYGGSNYSDFLPPHSFIDVRDYKTAASLAAYLKEVASDTNKFLSYFEWRKEFRQTVDIKLNIPGPYQVPDPRAFCDLCEYLHVKRPNKKVISDMLQVFGPNKYCTGPGAWLSNFGKI